MFIQILNGAKEVSKNTTEKFVMRIFTALNPVSASGEKFGKQYLPKFEASLLEYPHAVVVIETNNKRVNLSLECLVSLLKADVELTVIQSNLTGVSRKGRPKLNVEGDFFSAPTQPIKRQRKVKTG